MFPTSLPFRTGADVGVNTPTMYCKRCGRLLLRCVTDENGKPNDNIDEELSMGVCHNCYPKELQAIQAELVKLIEEDNKKTPEEVKASDDKYEAALKKYMEDIGNGSNPRPNL
jgi:hypothetical protein